MTSRERFVTALNRGIPDRIPLTDGFPWPEALERWKKEGMREDISLNQQLDLDPVNGCWLMFDLNFPTQTLEETDEYVILVDANGVTMKSWKNKYAPPLEMDFAIKTHDDWKQVKHRADVSRYGVRDDIRQSVEAAHERGEFHYLTVHEPMWYTLRTLGHDHCLEKMIDCPELTADMVETTTEFNLAFMQQYVDAGVQFDALWFWSDLCYKNGLLFSPKFYWKFMHGYLTRHTEFAHKQGWPVIFHSDGDLRELLPLLIEGGIDCMQPIEARCGNDVREFKKLYGERVAFFGNINADVMATNDRDLIEDEIRSKVLIAKEGGGYIGHSDHSIPPTVSWDGFRWYVEFMKKYGGYD